MMGGTALRRFFSYVEITTKITSIFPFFMVLALLFSAGREINRSLTGLFFVSMFLFDLATTAINNYVDTKDNHQTLQFSRPVALSLLLLLLLAGAAAGLRLAWRTDLVVLALGALSFFSGIAYTFGPLPLSRQPLGELFSGIFYGFAIPFLLLYINLPPGTFLSYTLTWQGATIALAFRPLLGVALLSLLPACATANIMLANNICDLEHDIAVRRHTLPYYLGDRALLLFALLYGLGYLSVPLLVICGYLHPVCLSGLAGAFPVFSNVRKFRERQDKATTFVLSVKNYVLAMGLHTLCILFSRLLIQPGQSINF